MTKVNLSDYNLSELKGLQAEIEKNIKARQQQEVTKAREQILTIAQTLGVSVEELLATDGAKAKGSGKRFKRSTGTQLIVRRGGPAAVDSQNGLLRGWPVGSP
jgi:predicted house-cleaning noncanonical NTP pyrophosphatase (MazG superfamily)